MEGERKEKEERQRRGEEGERDRRAQERGGTLERRGEGIGGQGREGEDKDKREEKQHNRDGYYWKNWGFYLEFLFLLIKEFKN